jgi:hypothetical protein
LYDQDGEEHHRYFGGAVVHTGVELRTGNTYNYRPVQQHGGVKNAHHKAFKKVARVVYFIGDSVLVVNIGFFEDIVNADGEQDDAAYDARYGFIIVDISKYCEPNKVWRPQTPYRSLQHQGRVINLHENLFQYWF